MKTCQDCPDREICVKLCPIAESFVNQDYVSESRRLSYVGGASVLDSMRDKDAGLLPDMESGIVLGDKEQDVLNQCGLTERQMQCFQMYYFKGMTLRKIGAELGMVSSVVSRHLSRAKVKVLKWAANPPIK